MTALPDDATPYKRTRTFDENTVPRGLLEEHSTRAGVWGRIVVEAGRLVYVEDEVETVLEAGQAHIVAPEQEHRVRPDGPVRFHVEFLRRP